MARIEPAKVDKATIGSLDFQSDGTRIGSLDFDGTGIDLAPRKAGWYAFSAGNLFLAATTLHQRATGVPVHVEVFGFRILTK